MPAMPIELKKHRETQELSGLNIMFTEFSLTAQQHLKVRSEAQQGTVFEAFSKDLDILVVAGSDTDTMNNTIKQALLAKIPVLTEPEYREILKGSRAGQMNLNRVRFKRSKPAPPKPIKIKPCIIDRIKAVKMPKGLNLSTHVV